MGQSFNRIDCPRYDPDLSNYEHWREEVEVWRRVTTVKKGSQGALLYFAIEGTAKQHVHNMNKDITMDVNKSSFKEGEIMYAIDER